ncbi:hypothetical protein Tco_1204502 [Tanacetum coccineum]
MVHQLTKFHVQRVDMVINPPWNLPFLGAKGLTSPEQTATGKGISNPFMAVWFAKILYGILTHNVHVLELNGGQLTMVTPNLYGNLVANTAAAIAGATGVMPGDTDLGTHHIHTEIAEAGTGHWLQEISLITANIQEMIGYLDWCLEYMDW